jgi:hypothetical protein
MQAEASASPAPPPLPASAAADRSPLRRLLRLCWPPQGVHMLFEGMPDRLWKEGEKRVSKMVFIGKDLDKELIEEGFRECIVKAA